MKNLSTNFKFLYVSQLTANTGDILYIIALIGYIYQQTKSAQSAVIIPIVITTAVFTSGFIAPYIYSLFMKKYILSVCQLLKTAVMIFLFLSIIMHLNNDWLYILAFINAFLDGFTNPLKSTLIPLMEPEKYITSANAQMSMMNSFVQIASWALGGLLLSFIGPISIIMITIILYIISSCLIYQLNFMDNNERKIDHNVWHSFISMMKLNIHLRESRFVNLNTLFEGFGHSVWIAAILLVFVKERLHVDTAWFGFINAAFFIGLLIGGLILLRYSEQLSKKLLILVVINPLLLSAVNVMFGLNNIAWLALILSLIFGVLDEIRTTLFHSSIQKTLNDSELTAMYTLNSMVYSLSFCLSSYIIALIVDSYGVVYAFILAGIAYFICFIISYSYRDIFKPKNLKS